MGYISNFCYFGYFWPFLPSYCPNTTHLGPLGAPTPKPMFLFAQATANSLLLSKSERYGLISDTSIQDKLSCVGQKKINKWSKSSFGPKMKFSLRIFCKTIKMHSVKGIKTPNHSHYAQTFFKSCPRFKHAVL